MKMGGGGFKAPKISKPAGVKTKIHPAAQARIRLPQGNVDMSQADPAPVLPGVGKI
jgi:hypothetical protein